MTCPQLVLLVVQGLLLVGSFQEVCTPRLGNVWETDVEQGWIGMGFSNLMRETMKSWKIMETRGWKPHILPIQMAIYCWRTHLSRDRPRYCRNGLNLAGQLRVRPPPSVRWSVSSWSWLQLHIASRLVCKNVMCLSHLNRPLAFLGPSKPHRKCLTV